ncbi:long-chain fatty acid-CoA ligase [Entomophthora muscae]|uniref:Long-chain fatty acid-CoA ligase n=1 Tax=Entomophthora muscae TaxID=34485 RepID=A0ACC2UM46_9FUNG|nr:long-chain fatty acid-CoA ligase [Entomophthora muscae]
MAPYCRTFAHSQSEEPDHSPVYRNHATKDSGELFKTLPDGSHTLYHAVQTSIEKHGPNVCFGSRRIVDNIEEIKEVERKVDGEMVKEKKTWKYYQLSPYEWVSFNELGQQLTDLGCAMKHIGLGGDKRLAIFAPTSRYWSTMCHASYTQNICVITVYDTLGAEGLKHGLLECNIPAIFITPEQIGTLTKILCDVPSLAHVILTEPLDTDRSEALLSIRPGLKIYSFDEFMQIGKENPCEHNPPTEDDVCLIMYTSGTTGNPKGVVINHRNIISIASGAHFLINNYLLPESDVYISFLPLAHILAFAVDCYFIYQGIRIAYGNPRTLTDMSVRNCKGDIREAAPTIMVGVPQIFDMIRKGILNKINSSGAVVQSLFDVSMRIKSNFSRFGLPTFLLDALVFKKVREQMGGRLRYAVSGGAPLGDETREFFSNAVCTLFQGYGLTEVCGIAVCCTPDIFRPSNIGQVSPSLEFKLVDVPDVGYFHTSDPPQGELWFRGPPVAMGYFKNEEATKEAFTEDGWFKTGDIVTYHDNGSLSVVDRKKNLAKLANGEYIALERLEMQYKNVLYVQNVCVVANSAKTRPVALVQVGMDAVNHYAKSNGLDKFHDLAEAAASPELRVEVLKAMQAEGKKANFNPSEIIIDCYLTPVEWTADNGLMTTSQKLKRKPLSEEFKGPLEQMYTKF